MTPAEQLEYKRAFDEIDSLLLTIDSHRNFHRRVNDIIQQTKVVLAGIRQHSADRSGFFRCFSCGEPATIQLYRANDNESEMFCNRCGDEAFRNGTFVMEESLIQDADQ